MILKSWDWMVLNIPFIYELDKFVKKIVVNKIKKI